jgi:hypothetical protein
VLIYWRARPINGHFHQPPLHASGLGRQTAVWGEAPQPLPSGLVESTAATLLPLRRAATLTESFLDNGERGYRYGAAICAANRPKTGSPDFP